MEKCKGNLKSHISQHPESVPGKAEHRQTEGRELSAPLEPCSRGTVIREVCRWVKEITSALAYIHN